MLINGKMMDELMNQDSSADTTA